MLNTAEGRGVAPPASATGFLARNLVATSGVRAAATLHGGTRVRAGDGEKICVRLVRSAVGFFLSEVEHGQHAARGK